MPDKVFRLVIDMDARRAKRGAAEANTAFGRLEKSVLKTAKATAIGAAAFAAFGAAKILSDGVRAAIEFEREMTRINTLVGVSVELLDQFAEGIGEIATNVGITSNELARALFVITSAGQRGAEAMEILEAAGKAAAVGLGETSEIASTVTSAMQAYGIETLSAEAATDILVSTVREGKLEASSLSSSLGRVVGIAAQAGLSFADLGAAIATYTRLGVNAEEAVTGIRATITSLLSPSTEQVRLFNEMGLSTSQLLNQLQSDGLSTVLLKIADATGGSAEAMAKLIPEARALSFVLGVTGNQAEAFVEIEDNVRNSTGLLAEAFAGTQDSAAFRVNQLKVAIDELGRAIGEDLLPTLTPAIQGLSGLVEVLGQLGGIISFIRGKTVGKALGEFLGADTNPSLIREMRDAMQGFFEAATGTADKVNAALNPAIANTDKILQDIIGGYTNWSELLALEIQIRLKEIGIILDDQPNKLERINQAHQSRLESLRAEEQLWRDLEANALEFEQTIADIGTVQFSLEGESLSRFEEFARHQAEVLEQEFAAGFEGLLDDIDSDKFVDPDLFWQGVIDNWESDVTDAIIESGTEAAGKIDWSGALENFQDQMEGALTVAIGNAIASEDVEDAFLGVAAAFALALAKELQKRVDNNPGAGFGASAGSTFALAAAAGLTTAMAGGSGREIGIAVGGTIGAVAGAALGSAAPGIGTVVGAAIGQAIGATIGGLIGGLFDDDGKGTVFRIAVDGGGAQILEGESERLQGVIEDIDQAFADLAETIQGSINLTESFNISVKENERFFANFFDAAGNAIGSAEFESFEAALSFAMARVLSTSVVNAEGPLAAAFEQVIGNAAKRGFEQTVADIQTLATLENTLDSLLGNFNLENDPALVGIEQLRKKIEAMGLDAETAAQFLDQLAAAEAQRIDQLQTNVLDRLFGFFDGTTQFEEQRFELAKKKVELEFEIIKAQLQLLDIWTEATQEIFNAARDLALDSIELDLSAGVQDVRIVEDLVTDPDVGEQERKRLRAEIRDFINMTGTFFGIVDELIDLTDDFLGANFRDELAAAIGLVINNRAFDIRGQLLQFVKDNAEWSDEFREWQEQQVRLEFELLRAELAAIDAQSRILAQQLDPSGNDAFGVITNLLEEFGPLLDAAEQAALEQLEDTVSAFADAIRSLQEFRDNLLTGPSSPLSLEQQFGIAQSEFDALLAAALAGDIEAINALPNAANILLDLAAQLFGSTAQFDAIFQGVIDALDAVIATSPAEGTVQEDQAARAVQEQTERTVPILTETLNVLSDIRAQNVRMTNELSDIKRRTQKQADTIARLEQP
jgi:TP901 family phage tail tape measure protein